jgi:hypothetical protein
VARRNEAVHLPERGLDEALAQEEAVGGDLRETAVAAAGACAIATLTHLRAHHQPIMGTDRVVVVQRHHDPGVRQDAAYQGDELHPDEEDMMNVHHVRAELLEQAHEMRNGAVQVDLAQVEAIEMTAPDDDLIGRVAHRLEARARALLAMKMIGCSQEERLHAGTRPEFLEQVVREDLRSARMEGRMIVGNDEDARHGASSGFTAMMTSW